MKFIYLFAFMTSIMFLFFIDKDEPIAIDQTQKTTAKPHATKKQIASYISDYKKIKDNVLYIYDTAKHKQKTITRKKKLDKVTKTKMAKTKNWDEIADVIKKNHRSYQINKWIDKAEKRKIEKKYNKKKNITNKKTKNNYSSNAISNTKENKGNTPHKRIKRASLTEYERSLPPEILAKLPGRGIPTQTPPKDLYNISWGDYYERSYTSEIHLKEENANNHTKEAIVSTYELDGNLAARYTAVVFIDETGQIQIDGRESEITEGSYLGNWSPDSFTVTNDGTVNIIDDKFRPSNGTSSSEGNF